VHEVSLQKQKGDTGQDEGIVQGLPMSEQLEPLLSDLITVVQEMPSEEVILGGDSEEFMLFLGNFTKFVGAAHYLIRLMMAAQPPDSVSPYQKLIIDTRVGLDFFYTCLVLPDAPTLQMESFAAHAIEALRNHLVGQQEEPVDEKLLN
jgi:hypothetical protein